MKRFKKLPEFWRFQRGIVNDNAMSWRAYAYFQRVLKRIWAIDPWDFIK